MKTATFPSLRVEQDLRDAAERVLLDGETLSSFIENAVRDTIQRRVTRAEFLARGLAARDEAKRTGDYVDADVVLSQLERRLQAARDQLAKTRK